MQASHARYKSCLNQKKKTRGQSKREEEERSTGGASVIKEEEGETLEEADKLATEAETKHKMDLLVKSNAMRSKSREKRKEIENEEKNIDGLPKKLKLM